MSYVLKAYSFSIPKCTPEQQFNVPDIKIKEIKDLILHGIIVDCETNLPVPCALVKIFLDGIGYYHTFTDQYGQYLFNIPYEWAGKTVVIKAVKTNRRINCECTRTSETEDAVDETI